MASAFHMAKVLLRRHEGFRPLPYKCTAGKWTIGYGRNLSDNGISDVECERIGVSIKDMCQMKELDLIGYWQRNGLSERQASYLLLNDIHTAAVQAEYEFSAPYWDQFSHERQAALIDMCFNLGASRFRGFRGMIRAAKGGDWDAAAREALDSLWARQVGQRAITIADILRTGQMPDWVQEQIGA